MPGNYHRDVDEALPKVNEGYACPNISTPMGNEAKDNSPIMGDSTGEAIKYGKKNAI